MPDIYIGTVTNIIVAALDGLSGVPGSTQNLILQGLRDLRKNLGVTSGNTPALATNLTNRSAAAQNANNQPLFPNANAVTAQYVMGSASFDDLRNITEYCALGIMQIAVGAVAAVGGGTPAAVAQRFSNGLTALDGLGIQTYNDITNLAQNIDQALSGGAFPSYTSHIAHNDVEGCATLQDLLALSLKRALGL